MKPTDSDKIIKSEGFWWFYIEQFKAEAKSSPKPLSPVSWLAELLKPLERFLFAHRPKLRDALKLLRAWAGLAGGPMARYVEGLNRHQVTLLPECLEDYALAPCGAGAGTALPE